MKKFKIHIIIFRCDKCKSATIWDRKMCTFIFQRKRPYYCSSKILVQHTPEGKKIINEINAIESLTFETKHILDRLEKEKCNLLSFGTGIIIFYYYLIIVHDHRDIT